MFRTEVLRCFKALHRTRKLVFRGDNRALTEGRQRINEEFRKNAHVRDEAALQELINNAKEVETQLRTCVIQAQEIEPGRYQAVLTEHTLRLENVPFNEEAVRAAKTKRKSGNKCCKS